MADVADTHPTYDELEDLEIEFEEVETEIVRKQYLLSTHIYAKRQAYISRIPHFWALVFEQAPPDVDHFIQPSDSAIIANHLEVVAVSRFEISPAPASNASDTGSPRSFSITFEFTPNEWFENTVLEKYFWYRRAKDGWEGLVSDPVKIDWKKGKDITEGLTDAAFKLWEAEKKVASQTNGANGKAPKRKIPEHETLVKKIESTTEGLLSFFAWFGFRGRSISAEESAASWKLEAERKQMIKDGKRVASREDQITPAEDGESELDREVFPGGDDLALSISDDLWPSAIKYFLQSHDQDDLSEGDFESDAEDSAESESGEINIRDLVRNRHTDESDKENPKKKRKA
ncbi:MAG: hypothetical protein M1812_001483 [Candelaria pacifica]|nr:MAG: hypothetical protein M1812_001483 [Candelaria pacifica]